VGFGDSSARAIGAAGGVGTLDGVDMVRRAGAGDVEPIEGAESGGATSRIAGVPEARCALVVEAACRSGVAVASEGDALGLTDVVRAAVDGADERVVVVLPTGWDAAGWDAAGRELRETWMPPTTPTGSEATEPDGVLATGVRAMAAVRCEASGARAVSPPCAPSWASVVAPADGRPRAATARMVARLCTATGKWRRRQRMKGRTGSPRTAPEASPYVGGSSARWRPPARGRILAAKRKAEADAVSRGPTPDPGAPSM